MRSSNIDIDINKKLIREIAKLNNDISGSILDDFIDNKLPELVNFLNTYVFITKHINLIYQPIGDEIGILKRGSEIAKSLRSKKAEKAEEDRLAKELAKLLEEEDTPSEYDMLKAQLLQIKSEINRLIALIKNPSTSDPEKMAYKTTALELRKNGEKIELKIKEIEEDSFKKLEVELTSGKV